MGRQYTIKDLEQKTGIKPRTIHFYIKEKLIPSADRAGGSASYSEEHIIRLRLIKEMKKSHLKLSGIRAALDGMSIQEMDDKYKQAMKGRVNWDSNSLLDELDYLQNLKSAAPPDSNWERFYIIEGIEINVRSDVMEEYKPIIMKYIEFLRSQV